MGLVRYYDIAIGYVIVPIFRYTHDHASDSAPTVGRWWPNVKGLRRWEFLSLVILWRPTFWSSKILWPPPPFFFPKTYDSPPSKLGAPFRRKCQPLYKYNAWHDELVQFLYRGCFVFCLFVFFLTRREWGWEWGLVNTKYSNIMMPDFLV